MKGNSIIIGTIKSLIVVALGSLLVVAFQVTPARAYSNSNMIDDTVFDNAGSLNEAGIQNLFNSYGNSCLKSFAAPFPNSYFDYGADVPASRVVRRAADLWGINPQVVIATLEKEESLVRGNAGCAGWRYNSAMGMGCPDGGQCPSPAYAGFSKQVTKGAWQLKFNKERANGNTAWDGDDGITYYGYMTQGNRKRCGSCQLIYYDGYAVIDGQTVFLGNGSTAALYSYTPHLNQSFPPLFETFFGAGSTSGLPSLACKTGVNQINAENGLEIMPQKFGGSNDLLTLTLQNNTSSKCIEMHTWTGNFQQWIAHTASNRDAINPINSKIISADLNGDGYDELILVEMNGTNSGRIEFHVWDRSNQVWIAHIASNHPCLDPSTADVISADTDGDNRDELYLVKYNSTASGKIEIHGWTPNMQQWFAHIATNHPSVDKNVSRLIAGDTNGDNKDEIFLVHYSGTTSGKIEIHGWTPNMQQWSVHTATNHSVLDTSAVKVLLANIAGGKEDEFILVKYPASNTSYKVEIHGWTRGLQGWFLHTVAAP